MGAATVIIFIAVVHRYLSGLPIPGLQDALTKHFDTRAATTQSAQALLRQVQAHNVAIDMPSLADSLNAVRTYKSKP